MKDFIKNILLINAFTVAFGIAALADGKGKEENNNLLFKIERSRDANEVFYEVNTLADGTLDTENPIRIYWVKHTENGKTEPLTRIQEKFGYGLKLLQVTHETARFQFVSFEQPMTLNKTANGKYKVFSTIDGQIAEVEQIYIQFLNNSFWYPKIGKVEMYATNPNSGKTLVQVINP